MVGSIYLGHFASNAQNNQTNGKQFGWFNTIQWFQINSLILFKNISATEHNSEQHINAIGQYKANGSKCAGQLIGQQKKGHRKYSHIVIVSESEILIRIR